MRRQPTLLLAAACLVLATIAAALASPREAAAFYGYGAEIVSADFQRLEQGDDSTTFAAISADGRYVAIQTRARNLFADDDPDPPGMFRVGGIFRFDTESKRLELVADGDLRDEASGELLLRGAQNPSISGDGRFVSFSTAQRLVAADVNDNVDVYVRDMAVPIRAPGAFELISVKDGGEEPASYGPPSFPIPFGNVGAEVSRGAAISRDGRRVAFRVEDVESDLPDRAAVETPGLQVLVRDRLAKTTTLVTRTPGGEPAGGAIAGPAISGDGTTVVWTGRNAPLQTEFLPGENLELPGFAYYLWQRFADGPAAPTRRVTGAVDPEDPACQPSGPLIVDELSTGPCFGPLARVEIGISANADLLPAISFDGRHLAFLTTSGPRPNLGAGVGPDVFVTEMSPGLSRKAATIELTREGGSSTAESAPVESVAMSGDGRYLALVTARTRFVLPALSQLGLQRAVPDAQDVYVVDLEAGTVERATRSSEGGDTNAPVVAEPTLSADGGRIAFVSFASNLFFGDSNQRSDAFVIARQPEPAAEPPAGRIGGERPSTVESSRGGPQISLRARSRPGGVVELLVSVPEAGGVRALARGRAGQPRRLRSLASADGRARGTRRSTVKLTLRLVRRYWGELRREGELRARASVTYVAARGGRRATANRAVVFAQRPSRGPEKRPSPARG